MLSIPKKRKDALKVLGFESKDNPSEEKIRKAYYRLVLKWHPDKWQTADKAQQKIAEENTKAINQAYAILTGKEVAEVEEKFNKMTSQEILEFLFGSHLSSDGSKRRLYLFAALKEGMLLEATCFLVGGKINNRGELVQKEKECKYVENINIRTKPNKQDVEHKAPLHYIIENACKNPNTGWETLLEETLQKRFDTENAVETNISDKYGVTPMHIAARHGRTDLMTILIDHGAAINVLDNAQRSPLDEAADKNYVKAVKFLLDNKDVTISKNVRANVDQKKYSPEMIAMFLDHPSFKTKNQTTAESCKGNATNPVTLKPTPKPTMIPGSTLKNDQNKGQGSSLPKEKFSELQKESRDTGKPSELGLQGMTKAYIQKLLEFKDTHNEHIKKRRHTSTEEEVSQSNEVFLKKHPQISFERSKEANYQTFAAHGTNAFVLFLAFAFANGQLLPGNARKQTGVPRIAGESQGKSRINSNFVSAVTLLDNDSSLFLENEYDSSHPNFYAEKSVILSPSLKASFLENGLETEDTLEEHYKNLADARYTALMKSFVNKYKRRGEDADLLYKVTEIFKDQSMREICIKLLNTPLITLGDGIGKGENKKQEQAEMGFERKEVLYERMNVKSIIIDEESQGFLEALISAINPEIAKNIAWFTNQEIEDFENKRWNITDDSNSKKVPEDRFLDAFIKEFGNRLNFTISQNFHSTNIQRSFLYSYSPTGQCDAKNLTILKKEDQPKVYSTSVVYFYHAKMENIVDNNNNQQKGSPKETVTSKPTPGPTIIPGSTLNSNQNGTSKTSIITQSSSSDNSQSNNNTRSLLIGLAIVAGAIIGAVALYFFAPLILGVSVGVGAKLGLGIVGAGAGAGAGAAIGSGIGCLTDVVISCCSSKAHAA